MMRRYPVWLRQAFSPDGVAGEVRTLVGDLQLATVCESALCPNLPECFSQRQLTFMILGDRCTRSCRFCAVEHGRPQPAADDEPQRVAEAVRRLGLRHVVITSVARDDLRDEGAGQFVAVIAEVRRRNPGVTVELLVPDFHAREELVRHVLGEGRPDVFAHNVETVERLSELLRPRAGYARSMAVLRVASGLGTGSVIKSSLMVGLGETQDELADTFDDLLEAGVTHLTIGQYLRPTALHLPVMEYLSPDRFRLYERLAYRAGFRWVSAGPFVRSSYHAIEALEALPAGSGHTRAEPEAQLPAGIR